MNESDYQLLREAAWRRDLSVTEQARLEVQFAHDPVLRRDWDQERALDEVLGRLPDAPLSSNFTAQVLQSVQHESRRAERESRLLTWLGRLHGHFLPRVAVASLLLALALFGWREYGQFQEQSRAHDLVALSFVASAIAEPQVLQDFDAIQRLGQTPPPTDDALFAALTE